LTGEAAGWERSGDYEKAIDTLIRALRLEPGDPELTLRLALCQLRSPEASRERAQASLEALTRSDSPAWIRSVAFQELARIALADGDASTAEALLRSALRQLPGDQQLSLQLAAVLDAQRRRGEAMTILDGIEILGWETDSPREIYDFWQPPDLREERAALHRGAEAAWPDLAAALRQFAAGGGA
jgi:thioredoxin-like negative regulator of GroEL